MLTAVPPALWNDEGNGNDVVFGLAIFMPTILGYHSPWNDKNSGSVEDGQLLVPARKNCAALQSRRGVMMLFLPVQRDCRKDNQQPTGRE